jgi:hypothetical protein
MCYAEAGIYAYSSAEVAFMTLGFCRNGVETVSKWPSERDSEGHSCQRDYLLENTGNGKLCRCLRRSQNEA